MTSSSSSVPRGARQLALISLLLLAGACVRPAPRLVREGPALLAVVTWNLNAGRGDLPALLEDLRAGQLTQTPPPDFVVLLQEGLDGGARDVRAIASRYRLAVHFSPARRYADVRGRFDARGSGNAILATLPLDQPRTIDLPRERQPRAAAVANVQVGGRTLFVASTHLENRLGLWQGLFGDRARARQGQALLQAIPTDRPGILGGDMNTMLGPAEPALKAFLTRFPDTPPRPTATFRDRLVLDHLFFDLPEGWRAWRRVVPDRYGSDHHPVVGMLVGG